MIGLPVINVEEPKSRGHGASRNPLHLTNANRANSEKSWIGPGYG
jgi:hypothetical protein